MQSFAIIEQKNGLYNIEGNLTFSSLSSSNSQSYHFLKSTKKIVLDLKKVTSADSAGLAFMIELIKQSKLYKTEVIFKNIPQQLLTLAKLSGFENNEYFSHFC